MSLYFNQLESSYQRMLCAKFGWSRPSGSEEDLKFRLCSFAISSLHGKVGALHLNKIESYSPKDALCQVWSKLAQWFWRIWKCEKFKTTTDNVILENEITYRNKPVVYYFQESVFVPIERMFHQLYSMSGHVKHALLKEWWQLTVELLDRLFKTQ